ncbi:hypothetical protein MRX96_010808 [Rhipicephalus microplus]
MTSGDSNRLSFHLSLMHADQLYSLEDETTLPIPHIRGMPQTEAVTSIVRHIAAIPVLQVRLECICRTYLCLMEKGVLGPWVVYQLRGAQVQADANFVISYLENRDLNRGFVHSMDRSSGCIHMCALVLESYTASAGFHVYCFCLRPLWGPLWVPASEDVFNSSRGSLERKNKELTGMLRTMTMLFQDKVVPSMMRSRIELVLMVAL